MPYHFDQCREWVLRKESDTKGRARLTLQGKAVPHDGARLEMSSDPGLWAPVILSWYNRSGGLWVVLAIDMIHKPRRCRFEHVDVLRFRWPGCADS